MPNLTANSKFHKPGRRALLALGQLALLPTFVGCASAPTLVERDPLDTPGTPQSIAVVALPEVPNIGLLTFATTPSEGAARGAAMGAAVGALTGFFLAPLAVLAGPAGVVGALSAIVAGSVAAGSAAVGAKGAGAAVSEKEAKAIEQLAADAIGELRLPARTAETVATDAKSLAGMNATVVERLGVLDQSGFRLLRERGFGVAIELKIKEIGFDASSFDKLMALFMIAEARLIDTATGEPVALRGLVYLSPRHGHDRWVHDGAALTRAEIDRAYRTLAERIVEDFLLRVDRQIAQSESADATCGLIPTAPPLEWKDTFGEFPHLVATRVSSLTPTLAWKHPPLVDRNVSDRPPHWSPDWKPGEPQWVEPSRKSGPQNVCYDLRIWNEVDGAPGALVYERERLDQSQHRVEAALEPGATYFWSVRMRYTVDARAGATRWSRASKPAFFLPAPLRDSVVHLRLGDGSSEPVGVPSWWMGQCQYFHYLDFIPATNYYRFRTP